MLLNSGIVRHCRIRVLNGHSSYFQDVIAPPYLHVQLGYEWILKRTKNRQDYTIKFFVLEGDLRLNKFTILIEKYSWEFIMHIRNRHK